MPKKFNEFLQEKAKTAVIADFPGPNTKAPHGGGAPYQAKTGPNKLKGAWADAGLQPVYTPGKGKAGKKADQLKETQSFSERTRRMSPKKFMEYMKTTSKNAAVIHETAKRTGRVLKENRAAAEALVRETKRNGTFGRLVKEMVGHDEFFDTMAFIMGSKQMGQGVCRRLARAMNEMVGPPAPSDEDDPPALPLKPKPKGPHTLGDEDDEDGDMEDDDEDLEGDDAPPDDDDLGDEDDMGGPDDGGDDGHMGLDLDFDGEGEDGMGDGDDLGGLGKPMKGGMGGDGPVGMDDDDPMGGGPMGGGMGDDDDPGMGDQDDPSGGDNPFGGDDDDSLDDKHKDDPDDDEHADDEEDDEDGEDDDENPFAKKKPGENPDKSFKDGPRPSMMSRMMRREHVTPAQRNFMNAFKTY